MSDDLITLVIPEPGVAVISLNRPERLNAINVEMRDALWETVRAVADHPDVNAVVLRSVGPHFSVGADLSEFGTAESVFAARRVRFERPLWELLWGLPQPIVAALSGYCFGSGLEMALLCDLRFSTSDAAFALPETRLGLIPAAGGSQSIARVAGPSRGLYTMLTGERMSATQALAWRIVDRIEVDVDCAALAVARQVARLAPESSRIGKQAIRAGLDLSRGAGLIAERRYARLLASLEA